jgi:hypothetical protein
VAEIARERGITTGTVFGHLARAAQAGETVELSRFLTREEQREVVGAGEKFGWGNLTGIYEGTGQRFDYNVLRIARIALQQPSPGS